MKLSERMITASAIYEASASEDGVETALMRKYKMRKKKPKKISMEKRLKLTQYRRKNKKAIEKDQKLYRRKNRRELERRSKIRDSRS